MNHVPPTFKALLLCAMVVASINLLRSKCSLWACPGPQTVFESSFPKEIQTDDIPELPELAVVHMGVHKTGSSSIQSVSKAIKEDLLRDGYEMPWVNPPVELRHVGPKQVWFSECFCPSGDDTRSFSCKPELLISGTQIAQRRNNIFVSAESFSSIQVDGIRSLKAYLSQWKSTKIVVYYRHYFDWLRSQYNQQTKFRKIANAEKFESDLLISLTKRANVRHPGYTAPLLERLREHFDDVEVVDFHDSSKDLTEKFFCDVLPNAPNSCARVTNAESHETINERVDLAYGNLAWAAKTQGLIEILSDEQMDKLCYEIKNFITNSLGKTTKDLVQRCLPENTMNDLLETSLSLQSEVFPDSDGSDLREFFEATKSKFCVVDTKAVLEEDEWKQFFMDFKHDQ